MSIAFLVLIDRGEFLVMLLILFLEDLEEVEFCTTTAFSFSLGPSLTHRRRRRFPWHIGDEPTEYIIRHWT